MTLGIGEALAKNIQGLLSLGGDGRNLLTQSTDLSHADWDVSVGAGSLSTTLAPGYKAGTNRSAQATDTDGLFVPFHTVGSAGDYANKAVTVSGWFQPVSGCTNLGLTLRNISGAFTATVRHGAPTGTGWELLQVTVAFGAIVDQIYLAFGNDDAGNPGAVWNVQDLQVEEASRASEYQPTTTGTTPLKTLLDAVSAEFADGVDTPAPSQWIFGSSGSLDSVPSWPSGYILVDGGDLSPFGLTGAGSGSANENLEVRIGVMVAGEPSNPGAMRLKLHRYMRAVFEAILDGEMAGAFGGATMGVAPVRPDFSSGISTENQMFADASLTFTFGLTETR